VCREKLQRIPPFEKIYGGWWTTMVRHLRICWTGLRHLSAAGLHEMLCNRSAPSKLSEQAWQAATPCFCHPDCTAALLFWQLVPLAFAFHAGAGGQAPDYYQGRRPVTGGIFCFGRNVHALQIPQAQVLKSRHQAAIGDAGAICWVGCIDHRPNVTELLWGLCAGAGEQLPHCSKGADRYLAALDGIWIHPVHVYSRSLTVVFCMRQVLENGHQIAIKGADRYLAALDGEYLRGYPDAEYDVARRHWDFSCCSTLLTMNRWGHR